MKLKVFFSFLLIIFIVFFIYNFNVSKKYSFLSVGDFNSKGIFDLYSSFVDDNFKYLINYNFFYNEMRTTDLINDIKNNKKINDKFLQNLLIKANLITINVGINDILSILESSNISDYYNFFDSYLYDVEELFRLLRIYDKEKIIFVGIYNPFVNSYNEYFSYLNEKLELLCSKYKIYYLDILDVFDDSYLDGIRFNDSGYNFINKEIKKTC